jgi:hypothetical protein
MKVRILVAVPKCRLGLTKIAIALERGDPDNPTHDSLERRESRDDLFWIDHEAVIA